MLTNQILNLLGLMARARKIVTGESVIDGIRKSKVYFVLIASDASDNTKKMLTDKCKSYHVDYRILFNSDELSNAIGKENRKAVGITDVGFAKKLKEIIKEGDLHGE